MPTFLSVVRAKYEHKKGSEDGGELVGGDKTGAKQKLATLARVFVPDCAIDSPGAEGEIAVHCGAIRELDISGNAFNNWDPVLAIAVQLPSLTWLGLDRLPLEPLDVLPDSFTKALGGLTTLCLSSTKLQWEQLLLLTGAMPKLEELHFSNNGIQTLKVSSGASPSAALPKLQRLFLESNGLTSWTSVEPLGMLPELTLLNLNNNGIGSIPKPSSSGFDKLCHLMLRANPINDWTTIDALNGFPSLKEARLAELPLTEGMSGAAARRVVIARVAKLVGLNGSEVRTREREDAERFYLRQVAEEYPVGGLPADAVHTPEPEIEAVDEYGRPLGPKPITTLRVPSTEEWDALQARHPRWAALLVHHGVHVTRTVTQATGGVIANELLEINMRSTSAEAAHIPTVTRKLPGGLPLKSVKLIACQLFKLEPTKQVMLYSPPGQDKDIPEPLEDDSKSLAELGVVSGGTIIIDDKS